MLRKILFLAVAATLLSCLNAHAWGAKKIIIKTIPETATISVDGQDVGEGSYTVKFDKGNEFYVINVAAPGYMEKATVCSSPTPRAPWSTHCARMKPTKLLPAVTARTASPTTGWT